MRLADMRHAPLLAYGTPVGVVKAWDTRGRKGGDVGTSSDDDSAYVKYVALKAAAATNHVRAAAAENQYDMDVAERRDATRKLDRGGENQRVGPVERTARDAAADSRTYAIAAHEQAAKSYQALADHVDSLKGDEQSNVGSVARSKASEHIRAMNRLRGF
ncbi:MAG: hypothetical protein KGL39_37635 [Patescibacteria group bacterium]|nr:hypothetical protein [Patescibacteria group bacterium]